MGCKYLVLSKNYEILETSLEGEELEQAMEYAVSGKPNAAGSETVFTCYQEKEYGAFNIILAHSLQMSG